VIDLSTDYIGLPLRSPLVASSGPMCQDIDAILRMEDAGIAAVVLHSLFEEQIAIESNQLDSFLSGGAESYAESLSYFPDLTSYNIGPAGYLEHIRKVKRAVTIPVIASLNGVTLGGWIEHAKDIEKAGADGLELNLYDVPCGLDVTGAEIEQRYEGLVRHVKACVRIPVAVKLSPFFSSIPNMAKRFDDAGVDGLVLFNRFYQPDFDLEALEVFPNLKLSDSGELLLRLHWTAILYGRLRASLAVTGGVHCAKDVLKSMMAGASVAMMTSALLRNGIQHAADIEEDLVRWMEEHEYESIRQMRGSMSYLSVTNTQAFERANYMKVLSSHA
jgi:dihydroorotate dehydrogenase (fumarate)